jgi:hypothetical protein
VRSRSCRGVVGFCGIGRRWSILVLRCKESILKLSRGAEFSDFVRGAVLSEAWCRCSGIGQGRFS